MRILWFTNNRVNLEKGLTRGGWMQRLERQLAQEEQIKLTVVTRYNGATLRRATVGGSTYYLVPDCRSRFRKRLDILLNREPIHVWQAQYLKIMDAVRPNIIHVFGTEMDYGLVAGLTDVPVVIHIQGILQPIQYHLIRIPISWGAALLSQRPLDYVKGSTLGNSKKVWQRRVATEQRIYKMARYFMGRTEWDRNLTRLMAPQAQYFHCDEMLRQEFLDAAWQGNPSESIALVSLISTPLYKGHELLISTCQALRSAGVKHFTWHVIGLSAGTTCYRIFYQPHLKTLGCHLRLHGELPPGAILDILRNADVYVHPSHIENSSNSICEAQAIGMPVIALHTGGNASLIEHGVDGLLVADNDPYTLAATILRVKAEPSVFREMGQRAQQRAKVRHDPERIVQQLKSIYREILAQHGQAA